MAAKGARGRGYVPAGRMGDSQRQGASASKPGTGRGQSTPAPTVLDDDPDWAVAYLDKLDSWDPYDKRSALSNLAAEGPRAAPHASAIAACLFYEEEAEAPEVRKMAAYALGKVGPACPNGIAKELARSLDKEADANARAEKAKALGLLGYEVAKQFLAKLEALAADPDEGVGVAAVEALTSWGQVDSVAKFINSPCGQVRRVAINEVTRSPEVRLKHKELIASRISDKETVVRLAAVQAIGDIGDAAEPEHLARLGALHKGERQVKVRKMAVQSLGRVGPAGIPGLLQLFRDSDEGVRHAAGETLGGVVGGPEAAAGASSMLSDPDARVRRAALLALGRSEKAGLRHCRKVSELFHDADFEARLAAIQAISDMRAGSQAEALSALAGDKSKGVRQAAVHALAKLGEDGASEAWKFIEDEDQAVRCCTIRVYSPLHSKLPAEHALPFAGVVATRLDDEDWRVRGEAAKALGDLHATEFAEQVAALANDPDGQTRRTAVSALGKMEERAWPLLLNFLDDKDEKVSNQAKLEVEAKGGVMVLMDMADAAEEEDEAQEPAQAEPAPPAAQPPPVIDDDDDDEVIDAEDEAPSKPQKPEVADDSDEVLSEPD